MTDPSYIYSEWCNLTNGEKAVYCAFNAPKFNNVPQIPEENDVVIRGTDYTPKNDVLAVFINEDGSLNENPDPNEIIKFNKDQIDAINLWLTEGGDEWYDEDEDGDEEWDDGESMDEDWDEEYSSDDGWSDMDEDW